MESNDKKMDELNKLRKRMKKKNTRINKLHKDALPDIDAICSQDDVKKVSSKIKDVHKNTLSYVKDVQKFVSLCNHGWKKEKEAQ